MPNPTRSRAEIVEDAAAQRRVHGALLGYQPLRMKPVHFATSFLLALTGRHATLEFLNKAAVPKASPRANRGGEDEYVADTLHALLISEGRLDPAVGIDEFRTLRAHLNAAFNNDGSALAAAFRPYSTFGTDYSAPTPRFVTNSSKNHGFAGSFVVRVFEATMQGREALGAIRRLLALPPPPLANLGEPLLDDEELAWSDPYEELFGELQPDRAEKIATLMDDCTQAIGRLARNLERQRSHYALRFAVLGLCCWLFTYMLRRSSERPLLLVDAMQGANARVRVQSRATYARAIDLFSTSYDRDFEAGSTTIAPTDWAVFAGSADARQTLDDHFRDLGVRIGVVQPRSAIAKHKHIDLQADTLRVLTLSLLDEGQVLDVAAYAERLRTTWSLVTGVSSEDGDLLRSARFGPLDRDDDLRPNAAYFQSLLVRLGLAVEPSDGLTLVAQDVESLI